MNRPRIVMPAVTGLILALVFASGAATGAKLITGKDIKDKSITTKDVKNNNLQGKDIKDGTVSTKDVKNNNLTGGDIQDGTVAGGDIQDGTVTGGDLQDGTVATADLANGSVTASKIAPGAIAFPNSLWSTLFRNQIGAAESNVQVGPGGAGQLGSGSLRLFASTPTDVAAFGNSFEFAGVQLDQIDELQYSTYNPAATPQVRPNVRIEINPHLVADDTLGGATEFTTLVHERFGPTATGWLTYADALADDAWRLTGSEGDDLGCNTVTYCTFAQVLAALDASPDPDTLPPAISTGIYFGLGASPGLSDTETAVDAFVLNGNVFDFEPNGVFVTPTP